MAKERLDKLVVDRGLCESRSQAQALIMDGKVRVKGQAVTKPGTLVADDEPTIEVVGLQKYVSRGGLKLEKALQAFGIEAKGRHCIDVGAATGGFTDCLLQNGATQVVALDVGYGQLDWKLRQDERVIVLEKTNIREVQPEALSQRPSLGVVDTSFISLKKVLPALAALLVPENGYPAEMMALLKPQFEYRDYVKDSSFKGVVKGIENHRIVLTSALADLASLLPGWQLLNLDFSPITGPKGNVEFLLHYQQGETSQPVLHGELLNARVSDILAECYSYHG